MAKTQVFIPLVSGPPQAREARLWEVACRYASLSEQAAAWMQDDKKLEPTVHLLGKLSRYNSGITALGAVRRLLGNHSEEAGNRPDDLEEALRDRRLVSAEGAAWVGMIQQDSSDLGLGLALLLHLVPNKAIVLAATGALGTAQDASADNDLPVEPVGDVPAKLKAMLEKKRGGGVLSHLSMVFTPTQYYAEDGELALVEQLAVVDELKASGVAVHPVASFAEAAQKLGIDPSADTQLRNAMLARETRRLWLRRAGLAAIGLGTAAVLAGLISMAVFLGKPIPLEWMPMERQNPKAEPFLICYEQGQPKTRQALAKTGTMPIAPVTGYLSWLARVGGRDESDTWQHKLLTALGYRGYPLAVVLIGKTGNFTGNSVFVPYASERNKSPVRVSPGAVWRYGVELQGPAEDNLLVLMANRWQAFDAETLKKNLQAYFKPEAGGLDLPAVENYLKGQANVTLPFYLQTRDEAQGCTASH